MKRLRLAAPILLLYWLMLGGGLALYAAIRTDDAPLQSLWLGAIAGTVLGHGLALLDMRGTLAGILVFLTTCWLNAVLPSELVDKHLWMAFVPGAMCAFWSLGDRSALVAFWFPAVIWMLSILDRTGAQALPDPSGVILLGGLAVMFIAFLKVREARRIRMWQSISTQPLADAAPATVLREAPGRHIARLAWLLSVGSIAFGVTAWLAPRLWSIESFGGGHIREDVPAVGYGVPCCPVQYDDELPRARVKEYFDLGRGHDQDDPQRPRPGIDCQICNGEGTGSVARLDPGPTIEVPSGPYRAPRMVPSESLPPPPPYAYGGGSYTTQGGGGGTYQTWTPAPTTPGDVITPAMPSQPAPTPSVPGDVPTTTAPSLPSRVRPPEVSPPQQATPAPNAPPAYTPPAPPPQPQPPAPEVAPPQPAPVPPPSAAPPPPAAPQATIEQRADSSAAPSLLRWIALLVAAALIVQLVALALRPVRRWLTLRHLRRPFWAETVDQRVSNAWQLALVGLRDAGWRATSAEAPREFAARTGVDGLDQCATILERARHGLGLDAEDLAEMNRSADLAYRSARKNLGTFSRAASWLRWPLA